MFMMGIVGLVVGLVCGAMLWHAALIIRKAWKIESHYRRLTDGGSARNRVSNYRRLYFTGVN
jgi:hypothetical protein